MYDWSNEQLELFNTALSGAPLILVSANAGAAKTTSSVEVAKRLQAASPVHKTRYLVFGTANASEAKAEFQASAQVSTIHSLAYHHTVKPFKLNTKIASWISWRDIPKTIKIPFGKTSTVIDLINDYCGSGYTDISKYNNSLDKPFLPNIVGPAVQTMDLMAAGKMRITHSFYLKLFHILVLNGTIKLPEVDTLLVDEVNDLSKITLDIVDAYPAKQKILVGDPKQAIHGWMGAVNAFDFYKGEGTVCHLNTSFRLSNKIAPDVELFLQKYCDPLCKFVGRPYETEEIKQTAYICRTNAAVIQEMAMCSEKGKVYRLVHSAKVKQMFKLPLAVAYAKPGFAQKDPDLKHLQSDIDHWGAHTHLQEQYSLLTYLYQANSDEQNILDAISLLMQHGVDLIINLAEEAEAMKNVASDYLITTAHSSKGLTTDHVVMDPSMDKAMRKAEETLYKHKSTSELISDKKVEGAYQEFNLYGVAITRARYKVSGASFLDNIRG